MLLPWALFSDGISVVGHYRQGGLFLEGVIKCCGGMVISVKTLKERRNVKMQEGSSEEAEPDLRKRNSLVLKL